MTGIILILLLAVTVEAIVEYAKSIISAFSGDKRSAALQIFAVAISVMICFAAGSDMYAALGVNFAYSWVGVLLTGIFASRGANYLSDLIGKLNSFKIGF